LLFFTSNERRATSDSFHFWENPMPLTNAHIGVLMGGASAEREISLKTGKAIYAALVFGHTRL